MPDVQQPSFCSYRPVPGEVLKTACPMCGHAFALHIGVEHCPVCELVHLNQQAREASVTREQVVRGEKSINAFRAARGLPPHPDATVAVKVEGNLDQEALRRAVASVCRGGLGRA